MKTNILVTATALSDRDLLARLEALAAKEREASVELVAHLAELDGRPSLYAAQGYGSLFSYCTQALRLSEDAACSRIEAARACRRFPLILELLASGSLSLTSVRLLGRHLTAENHESVLAKARNRTRREIPDGDPGAIFDRALTVLLEKVEKTKLGAASKPGPERIRPGADTIRRPTVPSRHVPQQVKRAVWERDGGQCAFVSPTGRRCTERTFLEFHHIQAYALQGPATVANISLRCWRHNQYEAELVFGPPGPSIVREGCASP